MKIVIMMNIIFINISPMICNTRLGTFHHNHFTMNHLQASSSSLSLQWSGLIIIEMDLIHNDNYLNHHLQLSSLLSSLESTMIIISQWPTIIHDENNLTAFFSRRVKVAVGTSDSCVRVRNPITFVHFMHFNHFIYFRLFHVYSIICI